MTNFEKKKMKLLNTFYLRVKQVDCCPHNLTSEIAQYIFKQFEQTEDKIISLVKENEKMGVNNG